jgi:hypothetical protein
MFGPERTPHNSSDPAALAEKTISAMLEAARRFDIDPGDIAALMALDLVPRLAAYGRSPVTPCSPTPPRSAKPCCVSATRTAKNRRH